MSLSSHTILDIEVALRWCTVKLYNKVHRSTKLKCLSSRLAVPFAPSIKVRRLVENKDVAGAGYASTIFEWSTILLPTKVRLILEVWR